MLRQIWGPEGKTKWWGPVRKFYGGSSILYGPAVYKILNLNFYFKANILMICTISKWNFCKNSIKLKALVR
jgi:hypothetical protein